MDSEAALPPNGGMAELKSLPPATGTLRRLGIPVLLVAIAAGAAMLLRPITPPGSVALVFLVAVLFAAVLCGLRGGIGAAGLAFLAYNFFFVEPLLTLRVAHAEDFLALAVFVLVAGLTGMLAGRLREQAMAAQERARLLGELAGLSSALGASVSEDEARRALLRALHRLTGERALILDQSLAADVPLDIDDIQAAERALRHASPQSAAAPGWSGGRYSFHPLVVGQGAPLVAGFRPTVPAPERERAVASAIEQTGAVIARLRLAGEADEARRQAERESLRAALLSSLSHDLKTPLATILGAVTSLRQLSDVLPEAARDDLLQAIEEEARRLNTYVGDLLHMTRLQAGLDPRLDWVDPRDILNGAVARARRGYPGRAVEVLTDPDLPLLRTDAALLEQALFNCLDNAAAIAPADTRMTAALRLADGFLRYSIEDEGPGVPIEEQQRIFEPFRRGAAATYNGTGLGLAITKGIALALGGAVEVESPLTEKGGARFSLVFPVAREPSA